MLLRFQRIVWMTNYVLIKLKLKAKIGLIKRNFEFEFEFRIHIILPLCYNFCVYLYGRQLQLTERSARYFTNILFDENQNSYSNLSNTNNDWPMCRWYAVCCCKYEIFGDYCTGAFEIDVVFIVYVAQSDLCTKETRHISMESFAYFSNKLPSMGNPLYLQFRPLKCDRLFVLNTLRKLTKKNKSFG